MIRIIELVGLLAPIGALVVLLRYRTRSPTAFRWGVAGCAAGIAATVLGVLGMRWSLRQTVINGGGAEDLLAQLSVWSLARFALLLLAAALLIVAALVDRGGSGREASGRGASGRGGSGRDGAADAGPARRPKGWIAGGVILMALSLLLKAIPVELGADHEGLTMIVDLLKEVLEVGFLGAGILLLSVAAVAHRSGDDQRSEPTELARRAGVAAWRLYNDYRRSRY